MSELLVGCFVVVAGGVVWDVVDSVVDSVVDGVVDGVDVSPADPHSTPASSACVQSCFIHLSCVHSVIDFSFPLHSTSSSNIGDIESLGPK